MSSIASQYAHYTVVGRLSPDGINAYDGINLNPLEVFFTQVKVAMLQADWTAPKATQTYDRWLSHKVDLLLYPPCHHAFHVMPKYTLNWREWSRASVSESCTSTTQGASCPCLLTCGFLLKFCKIILCVTWVCHDRLRFVWTHVAWFKGLCTICREWVQQTC